MRPGLIEGHSTGQMKYSITLGLLGSPASWWCIFDTPTIKSDPSHQKSDQSNLDLIYQLANIKYFISKYWYLISKFDIWYVRYLRWYINYDISNRISDTWECQTWYNTSNIGCIKADIWCLIYQISILISNNQICWIKIWYIWNLIYHIRLHMKNMIPQFW